MSNASISAILIENHALTLEELCQAISVKKEMMIEMVEYQLIHPQGEEGSPEQWRFDSNLLRRCRIAASFYHDLEVNMPGIALALELLEQVERLQKEIEILEKILK